MKTEKKRENEAQSTAGFIKSVDVMKGEKESTGKKNNKSERKKEKKKSVIFFSSGRLRTKHIGRDFFSIHKSVLSLSTSIT